MFSSTLYDFCSLLVQFGAYVMYLFLTHSLSEFVWTLAVRSVQSAKLTRAISPHSFLPFFIICQQEFQYFNSHFSLIRDLKC